MPARIFKATRNAMQSGNGKSNEWLLVHDNEAPRGSDPLMGWVSSAETATQVTLRFASKEEAEAYAKRKGIAYFLQPEAPVKQQKKSYSDNFKFGRSENWTH